MKRQVLSAYFFLAVSGDQHVEPMVKLPLVHLNVFLVQGKSDQSGLMVTNLERRAVHKVKHGIHVDWVEILVILIEGVEENQLVRHNLEVSGCLAEVNEAL